MSLYYLRRMVKGLSLLLPYVLHAHVVQAAQSQFKHLVKSAKA